MDEITEIKEKIKKKRLNLSFEEQKTNTFWYPYIIKLSILIIVTLIMLIILTKNNKFKQKFYKSIYENHFSFASVNNLYQSYFGSPIPFINFFNTPVVPVFNEKLKYKSIKEYKNGAELVVEKDYLVPALEGGIVIFIGDKDEYKNVVIIQQSNGIDLWYVNVVNLNVKIYDYIEKGSLIGEALSTELYLFFMKDGKYLKYNDYI